MSVVVYDSRRQVMAADTRAYSGSSHPIGSKMKIHRIERGKFIGSLVGVTTAVPGQAEEFVHWLNENAHREAAWVPANPDFEAILVEPNGAVHLYYDAYYSSGPLVGEVFTIGSGKKYALGAWHALQDAVKAVEVAIACDTMCGGPVAALPLHEPRTSDQPQEQLPLDLAGFSTGATLSSSQVA